MTRIIEKGGLKRLSIAPAALCLQDADGYARGAQDRHGRRQRRAHDGVRRHDEIKETFDLPRAPKVEDVFGRSFLPPKADRMMPVLSN